MTLQHNWLDKLVAYSLKGGLPLFILFISLILGAIALIFTPSEEEPQIVVPMADILVNAPGLSAQQIEKQVTLPLEKLLSQIPGVEHVYSTSQTGNAVVTLRFYVGEDREDSLLNIYNKLYSNQDRVPAVVQNWLIKPVEVDDVPIVVLGLWSSDPDLYSDFELRRFADEISTHLQQIDDTNQVNIIGGRSRAINILLDPQSLSARKTTLAEVVHAIKASNKLQNTELIAFNNQSIVLESGDFLRTLKQVQTLVINIVDGIPVYLQDVATILLANQLSLNLFRVPENIQFSLDSIHCPFTLHFDSFLSIEIESMLNCAVSDQGFVPSNL